MTFWFTVLYLTLFAGFLGGFYVRHWMDVEEKRRRGPYRLKSPAEIWEEAGE